MFAHVNGPTEEEKRTAARLELSADFRSAMRMLATTVSVVTTADEGIWYGMTATAVTSLCADPCALLVCINQATSSHGAVAYTRQFCVNLLEARQEPVARAFAGQLNGQSRFDVGSWSADPKGLPYLEGAQASIFCDVDQSVAYRTHTIFVGRVRDVRHHLVRSPLIYHDGQYAEVSRLQHPKQVKGSDMHRSLNEPVVNDG